MKKVRAFALLFVVAGFVALGSLTLMGCQKEHAGKELGGTETKEHGGTETGTKEHAGT